MGSTKANQTYKYASSTHLGFIHGGEDCISDQTRIVIKPDDMKFLFLLLLYIRHSIACQLEGEELMWKLTSGGPASCSWPASWRWG